MPVENLRIARLAFASPRTSFRRIRHSCNQSPTAPRPCCAFGFLKPDFLPHESPKSQQPADHGG